MAAPLRLTTRFGDFRVGVRLPAGSDENLVSAWLDPPGLEANLDLELRLGATSGRELDWYGRLDQGLFSFENFFCSVNASLRQGRGELTVENAPRSGYTYALLSGVVAAAHAHVLCSGGVLMHAATLHHRGRAYVIVGASGAGKSTLAHRFADTYLHDDYAFIVPEPDGQWWFWRHAETRGPRDERPWRVPLAGLLVLGADRSRTAAEPIAQGQAFAAVMAHAFHAAGAGAQPTFAGIQQLVHDHPPWQLSHSLAQPCAAILDALEVTGAA